MENFELYAVYVLLDRRRTNDDDDGEDENIETEPFERSEHWKVDDEKKLSQKYFSLLKWTFKLHHWYEKQMFRQQPVMLLTKVLLGKVSSCLAKTLPFTNLQTDTREIWLQYTLIPSVAKQHLVLC